VILVGWTVLRSSPPVGQVGRTQWVVMSGLEQRAAGWPLRSGSYVVVMGGADLDLRVADVLDGETYLDMTAIMGAIEVIVPPDISVECEGAAILGGVTVLGQSSGGVLASRSFVREAPAGSTKRLRVRCRAILGGVEFK
jgi:predicted membrane protein